MHNIVMRVFLTVVVGLICVLSDLSAQTIPADVKPLLDKYLCTSCHKVEGRLIGPGYLELAQKGQNVKELSALIVNPQPSNWPGYPPMAPMPHLPTEDVKKIATWIVGLKGE
jgi:cytochrome c